MTEFNKAIEAISPFLKEFGFHIAEHYKDFVRYESQDAAISVGYDDRERNFFTLIGNKVDTSIPLDVINLEAVFNYNIDTFIKKPFVDFVIDFFSTKGYGILTGDLTKLYELKRNQQGRAERYTKKLLKQQNMQAADKAWLEKNYLDFIKYLDLIDKSTLPKSYGLKYSIAKKHVDS